MHIYIIYIYIVLTVDGPVIYESARLDGADFRKFDAFHGRDIAPPFLIATCAIFAKNLAHM